MLVWMPARGLVRKPGGMTAGPSTSTAPRATSLSTTAATITSQGVKDTRTMREIALVSAVHNILISRVREGMDSHLGGIQHFHVAYEHWT